MEVAGCRAWVAQTVQVPQVPILEMVAACGQGGADSCRAIPIAQAQQVPIPSWGALEIGLRALLESCEVAVQVFLG